MGRSKEDSLPLQLQIGTLFGISSCHLKIVLFSVENLVYAFTDL